MTWKITGFSKLYGILYEDVNRIQRIHYLNFSWAHQVHSYSRNLAVNIWWTPMKNFNESDCNGRSILVVFNISNEFKFDPTFNLYGSA